jgi:hypothetical protein
MFDTGGSMKLFYRFFGLLIIAGFVVLPGSASAGIAQDAVDVFLTAVGSQSPDPGLSTALGAAPGAAKITIIKKCNKNLLRIHDELDNNPTDARRTELNEGSDRNQAVISAISGNPKALQDFQGFKKKREKEREKKKKQKQREEDRDSMMVMLNLYRDQVNELKAIHEKIKQYGNVHVYTNINDKLVDLKIRQDIIISYENIIVQTLMNGKAACDRVGQIQNLMQQKTPDYLSTMQEGENLVNLKINTAKQKFADCRTDSDSTFVKRNFQAAKKAFSTMDIIRTDCQIFVQNFKDALKGIKKANTYLKNNFNKEKWQNDKDTYYKLLNKIHKPVSDFTESIKAIEGLSVKIAPLRSKIIESRTYYTEKTIFPDSKGQFDKLINDLDQIKPLKLKIISPVKLNEFLNKYDKINFPPFADAYQNRLLFADTPPTVNCSIKDKSETVLEKLDEMFFRALLAIEANKHLRDGCQPVPTSSPPAKPSKKPELSNTNGTPPPNTPAATGTTPDNKPEKSIFGSLIIGGPSKIYVGQGAQFIALDGGGDPYQDKGGFSWINSREDIMVLAKSGAVSHALGFKPGKGTIILKYDGMRAYRDIEIIEKENSTSNRPDDDDGDNNLFGTSGGEDDNDKSPTGTTNGDEAQNSQLQKQCNELIDLIVWSINRNDADAARRYTNRAVALGCNINAGAVAGEIANIEKINQQNQICENIAANIRTACKANKAKNVQGFMAQANQNNCNIDPGLLQWGNTIISTYNQQIEDQRAAQKRHQQAQGNRANQQQNQQNLINLMNVFVNGVKGIQQENKKPPRKTPTLSTTSDPFPSSGTTFPPIPTDNPADYPVTAGEWGDVFNTGQPQNNKPSGSRSGGKSSGKCPGHTLICDHGGRREGMALDADDDEICDICNNSLYYMSGGAGTAWKRGIPVKGNNCKVAK